MGESQGTTHSGASMPMLPGAARSEGAAFCSRRPLPAHHGTQAARRAPASVPTSIRKSLAGSKPHLVPHALADIKHSTCGITNSLPNTECSFPLTPPKCHTNIYTQSHPHCSTHQLPCTDTHMDTRREAAQPKHGSSETRTASAIPACHPAGPPPLTALSGEGRQTLL